MRSPSPQAIARRWMHDLVCMSESCYTDEQRNDHARRTQSRFATAAVRAEKNGLDLRDPIHDFSCIGCEFPQKHTLTLDGYAASLRSVLTSGHFPMGRDSRGTAQCSQGCGDWPCSPVHAPASSQTLANASSDSSPALQKPPYREREETP